VFEKRGVKGGRQGTGGCCRRGDGGWGGEGRERMWRGGDEGRRKTREDVEGRMRDGRGRREMLESGWDRK